MLAWPAELPHDETPARMLDHVRAMFGQLLAGRGFSPTDLAEARLSLAFSADFPDLDLFSTHARLEAGGRCFEKAFQLPPNDALSEMRREKGMTLLDRMTTRAPLL